MIIAKTNPTETLKEHTNELLLRYEKLKESYERHISNASVWKLLYYAAVYHDTGKAYSHFQYRMRITLGQKAEKPNQIHIPHNYLSPFYLPLDKLYLKKQERRILIEAITYHHDREHSIDIEQLKEVAESDLICNFEKVRQELNVEIPKDNRFFKRIADDMNRTRTKGKANDKNYLTYVLVKGLLHRLDHAASAHVEIEVDSEYNLGDFTENYLKKLNGNSQSYLRPLQSFTLNHQNKNIILTAQTGMGKTEAALLWAGDKKSFFTVPLRVSLNALYDRVSTEMKYSNCGLLHSSSAHHLDENGFENWEVIYDQSQHFSNKLTFTTIDQILKFPFKFRGYEKYYATLAYSCVIIDEIQAYSPWLVAVVIKAIEMIHDIGGKFMIMTATLPKIYLEALKEKGIIDNSCIVKTFYDDSLIRHRYKVTNENIFYDIDNMASLSKTEKVLVIVNTVDQAIKVYQDVSKKADNVYLFHARYLQKDRQLLEKELKGFDKNTNRSGIWITTQIVEASIDIDFDRLFTELAPLDSLFQRFGRCYRKRQLNLEDENIRIYTKNVSGEGAVYDRDILNKSRDLLVKHNQDNNSEIIESTKMKMVEELYSKASLQGTKFYEEFLSALNELDYMEDHTLSHEEAQKQLRGDQSVMVIPRAKYDEIITLFEKLEVENDKRKRTEIRRKIELYTCSVNRYSYEKFLQPIDHYRQTKSGKYPLMSHLFILDKEYDFDEFKLKGVGLTKEESSLEGIIW